MKAARLSRKFSLKIERRTLALASARATGASGPSLLTHLLLVSACAAVFAASSR